MRRNRIILAVLWLLSLLAISFYGGAVSYGLFTFFSLIPAAALLYILAVRAFFRIYQEIDGRDITANRPSVFYYTLQNESLIAFSGVRVMFYSSFSTISDVSDLFEYGLLPKSGIKKHTGIVCRYRGEYEVGIKKVVITDFLRLFSITYNNREPFTVTVRPDIVHLDRLRDVDDLSSSADSASAQKSMPDVLSRQYVPGDDVRMINWKVSAAKGELMTRDIVGVGQRGIGIIMDPKRYGKKKEDYLPFENRMLEILIALTLFYCKKNIPVNLFHTMEQDNKNVVEMGDFEVFYQRISEYYFDDSADPALFFDRVLKRGDIFEQRYVFLILREWDESLEELVESFSRRSIPVKVYLVTGDGSLLHHSVTGDGSLLHRDPSAFHAEAESKRNREPSPRYAKRNREPSPCYREPSPRYASAQYTQVPVDVPLPEVM